jgi:hypothetical protein
VGRQNRKSKTGKGFSLLTSQLTRWSSGVRVPTSPPLISLNTLRPGRPAFHELDELVTARHHLRKPFHSLPLVCGNRQRVDLQRCGHLAVVKLDLCVSQRRARRLQQSAVARLSVCQFSHGAPSFFPVGFKCRCSRLASLSGLPLRLWNTKDSSSVLARCPHIRARGLTSPVGMGSVLLLPLVFGVPIEPR